MSKARQGDYPRARRPNDVLARIHWPGREGTATSAVAFGGLTHSKQLSYRLLVFGKPGAGEIVMARPFDLHEPLRPVDRVVEPLPHVERHDGVVGAVRHQHRH